MQLFFTVMQKTVLETEDRPCIIGHAEIHLQNAEMNVAETQKTVSDWVFVLGNSHLWTGKLNYV